jgi:TPR repeat protein
LSRLARRLALTFLLLCVPPAAVLAQTAPPPPAGQLTADDLRQVFERLVTASDKGDRKAFARFSRLYPSLYQQAYLESSSGGPRTVTSMIPALDQWLLDRATAGSPTAQYWMGERTKVLQQFGAAPPPMADVEKWYRAAAEQGFAPAQNSLGQVLGFFPEFAKQPFEAEKWLFAAVRAGEEAAGDNLLQAIEIDQQRAHYKPDADIQAWLKQRASAGDERAKKALAEVGSQ